MSNIQVFQDAFAVDFPVQIAEQVLERMEKLYGSEFHSMHQHISNSELLDLTCTVLEGVSPTELRRGIERMNIEKRCPKLNEFRTWCGGEWLGANEAWAIALAFSEDRKTHITVAAKQALDQTKHIMQSEGVKSAGFAFREIYSRIVNDLKATGQSQIYWQSETAASTDNILSYTAPEARNRAIENLDDHQKKIIERQCELIAQGISVKQARIQAQREIGNKPTPVNKLHNNPVHVPNHAPVTKFQELIAAGVSVQEAFKQAKGGAA
ncbi:hypothetical protein QK338_05300 [Acinetobacter ursingii]|uniref:hypothetical protein n=1 Tax=Acinetobacter ursingii TaxID=108980 RepID=UPI00124FDC20|nr:hypothetical protein [Acinetobacter ursingii]MDI3237532.1 hypothetical protein [Acinetobacter ursingii]